MTDYIATDGLYVFICAISMLSVPALMDLLAMHIITRLEGRKQKKRPAGVASTYEAGGGSFEHESTSKYTNLEEKVK